MAGYCVIYDQPWIDSDHPGKEKHFQFNTEP